MTGAMIEEIKTRGTETVYAYLRTLLQTRILNDFKVVASLAAVEEREEREEEWLEPGPA